MAGTFINIPPLAPGTVDSTELGYLDGVTSNIQTQLDALASADTALAAVDTALKVQAYSGMIETAADKIYVIDLYTVFAGTINQLKVKTLSGTCTVAVKINGTSVTGISAVSASSTIATGTASAANTFAVGDAITLVVSSNSSALDLQFNIKYTR